MLLTLALDSYSNHYKNRIRAPWGGTRIPPPLHDSCHGCLFCSVSSSAAVPASLNYIVESFQRNPHEVSTGMDLYRLLMGTNKTLLSVKWQTSMSIGWMFATAAFVGFFTWILIMLLMWKGTN